MCNRWGSSPTTGAEMSEEVVMTILKPIKVALHLRGAQSPSLGGVRLLVHINHFN